MAVTAHLTAFGDEQLDADLAIVLGGNNGFINYSSRQDSDQHQLSLAHLLSSRQASATIGFSLAIVFVLSATFAVIHNPRKGAGGTSPAENAPLQTQSEQLPITNNSFPTTVALAPEIYKNTLMTPAAPHTQNNTRSVVRGDKSRPALEDQKHLQAPDSHLSAQSVALLTSHSDSTDRSDISSLSSVNLPHDVAPRVAQMSQSSAPAIMSSAASTSEAVPDDGTSTARARRDSITALRSLRRQW